MKAFEDVQTLTYHLLF